ncbi:MAG: serine/threonine protein kinase [Myxococcales bacterium]|nr:serine/threonine protein kinase [Myxococcales bacterium]
MSREALAAADGDPFLGMVVGGRYAIMEVLGAGSMGTVYRARQEAMRRDVALKIVRSERLVDPQAKGRFQQEAQATSLLTSPHTVTVFDFGEIQIEGKDPDLIGGSLFLAMELLEGESLGTRLKRVGRVAPREAVRIVRHALASLAEAHDKGVIHRDLKPDNLLLVPAAGPGPGDEPEICKVLDFGIAKLVTREAGIDALETQAGTVFGTPRYMSPEQAQGKALDARSDLYALGVILYHMLLGRPPYTDNDAVVVMAHHIKTVPKRPTVADPTLQLPADLERLLMRVLDKDPQRRPQSAKEFIEALDALDPLPARAASSPPGASASLSAVVPRLRRAGLPRSNVLVAGGVAVGLAVLALALSGIGAPRSLTSSLSAAGASLGVEVLDRVREHVAKKAEEAQQQLEERSDPDHVGVEEGVEPAATSPASKPSRPRPRGYERFDR